jgi:putative ubiquitin-RnfH superfamily antitoxin RatB of RatAB toxin-antitoxin module
MAEEDSGRIPVEVCYAEPDRQVLLALEVPPSTTVRQVIQESRILEQCPQIDLDVGNKVGIFGQQCDLDRVVSAGDRIEIYRPLVAAPQELRRRRAEASRGR